MKNKTFLILFFALGNLLFYSGLIRAQTPTPTATPTESASPAPQTEDVLIGGYKVTSSVEFGARGSDVSGSENKFRSDFNYQNGLRIFDSSLLMENKAGTGRFFDTLLLNSSGWGADPTGIIRFNVEKLGIYRFDSNTREVTYFNKLSNHALGEHTSDTKHRFGDYDLTIGPQNEKLRFRLGASFNKTTGDGGFTTNPYNDEFPVLSRVKTSSHDFRGGIDAKLLGFNLSLTKGYRKFDENTNYLINGLDLGNNADNNSRLETFERSYPINGKTNYSLLTAHRTFAKKLDLTGRFIYSATKTDFSLDERQTGRDFANNIVDLDQFNASGASKRIQDRGDIGITYLVTNSLRISETLTFDQFNLSGGNEFFESLARRNATGTRTFPTILIRTASFRATGYRRTTNLIEGDYQINKAFGFNFGYRYTNRRVRLQLLDRNVQISTPLTDDQEFDSNANSFIAGFKLKPIKNWTIYADFENGQADNVFTRLANFNYTNLRVQNRVSFNKFALNASLITKDNDNPTGSIETAPADFTANTKVRIFSASFDYDPITRFSISTGYTYQFQDSRADIFVPINNENVAGLSRYFMRDGYFFLDVSARPVKRISVFASFRADKDKGQGERTSAAIEDIIGSYPYRLLSPEFRVAVRLRKNLDFNAGYQYYDFRDRYTPTQSYSARLPYLSLRYYFGGGMSDH